VRRDGLSAPDFLSPDLTLARRNAGCCSCWPLASHIRLVIPHNQLIRDIWGDNSPNSVRYLRTLVRKLRQKLEQDPSEPKLLMSESGIAIAWSAILFRRCARWCSGSAELALEVAAA
jgi:hypothetical protein